VRCPAPIVEPIAGRDDELARLAYHDSLTGLPNRARMAAHLTDALARAGASGSVVLLSIDLDDFKLVNDGLGHAAGDKLLAAVARRLEEICRPGDLLARQGGDEFLLVVSPHAQTDARDAASSIAWRISAALEAAFPVAEAELRVGASIGAAIYPTDATDAETLQRHADSAMYRAKQAGGGFAFYEPGGADPLARLSLASALRQGLHEDVLEVHYQPIFRLPEVELMGVEALARWADPVRGMIPPSEFIPVAEKTGVIHALGHRVLERVCADLQAWGREGMWPNIGINLSPTQLQRASFVAELSALFADAAIDPERIVLELTESAWALESGRFVTGLQQLRAAGFTLALDDFGAGHSTLSRLRQLPVQVIKIDRSFLSKLPGDPQGEAIVEAILALATACGCDVVCEGVETAEQLDFLIGRDCRLVQGFHLGRPQTPEDITRLLRRELVPARRAAAG
jgi:diguanylate cyclase (GGDEF)-like protein